MTPTEPARLPQFRGAPVPWVTRWSGEVSEAEPVLVRTEHGPTLSYPDGQENRDDHGVLWRREGISRAGQPLLDEVNVYRQRMSLLKRRCHVCGSPPTTDHIYVLVEPRQLSTGPTGETLTTASPLCLGCVELAKTFIPVERHPRLQLLRVDDLRIWGVYGRAMAATPAGGAQLLDSFAVQYTRSMKPMPFLAEQLIGELREFAEVPQDAPG